MSDSAIVAVIIVVVLAAGFWLSRDDYNPYRPDGSVDDGDSTATRSR